VTSILSDTSRGIYSISIYN